VPGIDSRRAEIPVLVCGFSCAMALDPAEMCGAYLAPPLAPPLDPPRSAVKTRNPDMADPSKTGLWTRGVDGFVPPNGGVENPPRRPLWSRPLFSTPPFEGSTTPLRWADW